MASRGVEHHGIGSAQLDIADQTAVFAYLNAYRPNAVIHCAACTAVDRAESERETLPAHFIVRISWAFGVNGKNFVKTLLHRTESRDSVSVVNDQIGSPTYTADLALLLCDLIKKERYGTYHATNEGVCSLHPRSSVRRGSARRSSPSPPAHIRLPPRGL